MLPLELALRHFNERSNAYHARNLAMNYQGADVGLRSIHGPAGVLIQHNCATQLYSAKGRVSTYLPGVVEIEGLRAVINSAVLQLNPNGPENFIVLGKNLNRDVFSGEKRIVTSPQTADLSTVSLVTTATRVLQDGSLIGTTPLSDVLHPTELFVEIDEIVDEDIEQAKLAAQFMGVTLL